MLPLKVIDGYIFNEEGTEISNVSAMIDIDGGLMKYGEADWLDEYYNTVIHRYNGLGLSDIAEKLVLIKFDGYDGLLSKEEICTILNYMVLCSANGNRIMKILMSDESEIHKEVTRLNEVGY